MKNFLEIIILACVIVIILVFGFIFSQKFFQPKIVVEDLSSLQARDFFQKAKEQIGVVTKYDLSNGYYGNGGFPPEDTGVCSDVIWRALARQNIDIKSQLDVHMKQFPDLYATNFDSNINFRRVKNLHIFWKNTLKQNLTTKVITKNAENLKEWRTGDIVVFDAKPPQNLWHIGIVADKRDADGVPYMIDNHGYGTKIRMTIADWRSDIVGHYRLFE